jgi:pimeloyl-ACP methyl ester carboxylesterase
LTEAAERRSEIKKITQRLAISNRVILKSMAGGFSTKPWIIAPQNVAAREKAKALLTAYPRNLDIPWQLVRWPKEPALGRLSQIKAPTLLVAGESDIPDVHAHIGAIEAGIIGAKRVVLANSGHLPHLEVPEAFNKVVLDFLRETHL